MLEAILYPAASIAFFILVSVIIGRRRKKVTPDPALLATGEAAEAVVVTSEETGTLFNDVPVIRIILDVRRASGPAYRPEQTRYRAEVTMLVPHLKFPQIQPGSVVAVKVDPSNSSNIAVVLR
jgi:hypothetical protein